MLKNKLSLLSCLLDLLQDVTDDCLSVIGKREGSSTN